MGTLWGWMKMILQLWEAIKAFLGMVEKAKHEHEMEEIKDKTDVIQNPSSTEEERLDAVKDLEDRFNSRT